MSAPMTPEILARGFVEELGSAVGATLGREASVATAEAAPTGAGWFAMLPIEGAVPGALTCWFDRDGAIAATKAALMLDEAPDAAAVADLVREMSGQAAGALVLKAPFAGVKFGAAYVGEAPAQT